jgi:hypothetical protein
MQARQVFYAAVGAPVVVARKVTDQVSVLREKVEENATSYGKAAEKTLGGWATEGEKIVARINEGKVGEISAKVDLDQAKEQVSKLRDQLEDMLATWRTSFRPEKPAEKDEAKTQSAATSPSAAKPAAAKPAARKPAAKKPAAKKPAARKPAAKAAASKTTKAPAKASTTKASEAKDAKAS